jgi:RNA polymerase sigma-70 factor (ECF subfamily)
MGDSTSVLVQGWLVRLAGGDKKARDELIRHSCGRLETLSRRMLHGYARLRRWEDTGDVMQESVLRLCQALAEVTPPTPRDYFRLATCQIRRVLIDLTRHHFGRQGPGAKHASVAASPDSVRRPPSDSGDDSLEASKLAVWSEFHQQVEKLPPNERDVFDLLWYQELTQEEAAQVLGVTDRTVRSRWRDARSHLVKALGGQLPG